MCQHHCIGFTVINLLPVELPTSPLAIKFASTDSGKTLRLHCIFIIFIERCNFDIIIDRMPISYLLVQMVLGFSLVDFWPEVNRLYSLLGLNCFSVSCWHVGGWVHGISFSASGEKVAWVGHDSSISVVNAADGSK